MAASREDIKEWIKEGQQKKATHLIVVCDTFDWEDYPVYVMSHEDAKTKYTQHNGPNMQKVMEVYNLSKDINKQLNSYRNLEF